MCSKNPGLVLKVSLVNSLGETVLDTLVDFSSYQVYKTVPCPEKVEIKVEEEKPKETRKVLSELTDDNSTIGLKTNKSSKLGKKRLNSQRAESADSVPEKVEELVLEFQKTVVKRRKFELEVKSMEEIHGISQSMLDGAPTLDEVKTHILSLLSNFEKQTKEKVVLVGHGLINDIEALHIDHARFIDTTNFKFKSDQQGKIRKLRELAQEHLGVVCQAGHHSSLEDA